MATLSVLSYNLAQAIKMKTSTNSGNTATVNNSGTSANSSGGGVSIVGGIASNLSKTFNKITVLSESNGNAVNITNNHSNNAANAIVRKIKDFGMFGTVNNAANTDSSSSKKTLDLTITARKRPLDDLKSNVVSAKKSKQVKDATTTPKALKKSTENVGRPKLSGSLTIYGTPINKAVGTPGRKGLPLPQAVARRNARERNRVKQVNNGFAALRERIPEEVAEAFEAHNNGRAAAKKLSKVETLRMAVEYIRSLERLLGFDFPLVGESGSNAGFASSSSGEESFSLIKDEFDALSPRLDEQFDDSLSNYDVDEYFGANNAMDSSADTQVTNFVNPSTQETSQMDLLPNLTTLNGLQYIRIPGTNTYQLLTPDIFANNSNSPTNSSIDDEQFNALIDTNCQSPAASVSAFTAADLHASPPSIKASANTPADTPTAAMTVTVTASTTTPTTIIPQAQTLNKCIKPASVTALSRSPVPRTTSSPSATNTSTSLHHNQLQQLQQATLSPAITQLLLQTCASSTSISTASSSNDHEHEQRQFVAPTPPQQHHLQQAHIIKQEFVETDFVATTAPSPAATRTSPTLIYQAAAMAMHNQQQLQLQLQRKQQQQQLLLGHTTLSMSPPLDRCNNTTLIPTSISTTTTQTMSTTIAALHSFYEHEQQRSFYEGVSADSDTFKKELNQVLLDSSTASATLSDESMIDAIDWWEAHTPKSDGGSVIL